LLSVVYQFAGTRRHVLKVLLVRSRATDSAIYKVANTLADNGYAVQLLVWDRQNMFSKPAAEKYTLRRFTLKAPYDKFSAVFFLPFWWIYELFFLLTHNADIIHVCDLDTLIPAIWVKIFRRKTLFYTIYDYYSENISSIKSWPLGKLVINMVSFIENKGIGFTDILFLVDECRYEEVKGAKIRHLEYIYNSPEDILKLEKDNTIGKKELVIIYIGVLTRVRGLDQMIKAVSRIEDVRLVIGGIGPEKKYIEDAAAEHANIKYLGWLKTYDEVLRNTLKADVVFRFSDPQSAKTRFESPNKLFEAMMCAKPIIVSAESSMAEIVKKESCGMIIPYGSINDIVNVIAELKTNPQLQRQLGENGRRAYEQKYSWTIMEQRLLSCYRKAGKTAQKPAK
jgi:glycosyltransferase involved in cell wall biosynthesis